MLIGGVDTGRFRPRPGAPARPGSTFVVGGLADKNPEPLVAALAHLPRNVVLRLFDVDLHGLAEAHRELVAGGRLELVGTLDDEALARFYHEVDCVVATELFAGWSNLAAEALASGTPVVCTPHGTGGFARDGETALVVGHPTPEALAAAVRRLISTPGLRADLAARGPAQVAQYSWDIYARRLVTLLEPRLEGWAAASGARSV